MPMSRSCGEFVRDWGSAMSMGWVSALVSAVSEAVHQIRLKK